MSDAVSSRVNELRAQEKGRGRNAEKPRHIPWLGWRDILSRLREEISQDRIGTVAAGTAFYLLLALFPSLAALVSLYGLVADPVTIGKHLAGLRGYIPADLIDLIGDELTRLIGSRTSTLGLSFIGNLLLALWSASSGIRALFDALNVAYDETEKRSFLELLLISVVFTIGTLAFFILLINLIVAVPLIMHFVDLGPAGGLLVAGLPAVLMLGVALLGLAILYRYGPSRTVAKWRWITPGSVFAAALWLLFSALFTWYLANWAGYSALYGSLSAIVGVMMWLYLSLWVVLIGAELNAEIEHQTARDSTVGPAKPLGARGAVMADDVGEARA